MIHGLPVPAVLAMATEQVLALTLVVGLVLASAGWFWLLVRAFRTSLWWGLVSLFVPPLLLLFVLRNRQRVAVPLTMLLLGLLVSAVPYGVNWAQQQFLGLGPHEQVVDGECHLTLTGWNRTDYGVIATRPHVVVLQMANPDVSDETLAVLRDRRQLKELDLNDTAVTDAALPLLAELPVLRTLRLKNTKITDEGFQQHLAEKDSLRELDVRETGVAAKSLRAWKNANPERRYLK